MYKTELQGWKLWTQTTVIFYSKCSQKFQELSYLWISIHLSAIQLLDAAYTIPVVSQRLLFISCKHKCFAILV
ncbi:hypothetical protein TNIN_388371 [Trichonephila inaurata madagascariensis]|uniref:Uncharacterized protein n=1 Tax=Trichonephila inaurata madagascariensis TaxID=2747483 RepID=A0A8X6YN62_9ARAC|nr:hypothetical protein TNIN_388371 [Trichonephila inaurata madagascariensis]